MPNGRCSTGSLDLSRTSQRAQSIPDCFFCLKVHLTENIDSRSVVTMTAIEYYGELLVIDCCRLLLTMVGCCWLPWIVDCYLLPPFIIDWTLISSVGSAALWLCCVFCKRYHTSVQRQLILDGEYSRCWTHIIASSVVSTRSLSFSIICIEPGRVLSNTID